LSRQVDRNDITLTNGHAILKREISIENRNAVEAMILNTSVAEDTLTGQTIHLRPGVDLQVCYSPGKRPAVVFLHGGMGNRFNLRSQYDFFHAQGREVLAYDLAGHGQSSPYRRYSLGRHRRDLTRLLHRFNIKSPVLCCHSYGVPIGLEWIRRHPASALIAIAGGTHDLAPWWEIPLMKFLAWGGRHLYHLPGVQKLTRYVSTAHRHEVMERFFVECPVPTEFEPYQALEIFWSYNFFRRPTPPLNSHLPVLAISGGQDSMFTLKMGEDLAACFPTGEHLHLPDAGHLVMAEYPDVVNEAIELAIERI
jgi:pimeloyl-ACP methyl ester carboxylesterase